MQLLKPDAWTHLWTFKAIITSTSPAFFHFFFFTTYFPRTWLSSSVPRARNNYFAVTQRLLLNATEFFRVLTQFKWFSLEVGINSRLLAIAVKVSRREHSQQSADLQENVKALAVSFHFHSQHRTEILVIVGKVWPHGGDFWWECKCTQHI